MSPAGAYLARPVGTVFVESPFRSHVGIDVSEAAWGSGDVRVEGDHLDNHVGSKHAGALFATGDCGGAALIAATFPFDIASRLGVRSARIRYERMAKGPIRASARLIHHLQEPDLVNEVALGRVKSFEVEVTMTDEARRSVATMTLDYCLESFPDGSPHLNGNGRRVSE
jgi:acyl-coenzyme A thioesterase PaaI-like protein